ncbi:MAG TPA: ATP-binding cassette domain-containing protein [Thermoanaerobaculia bacterium]|nr:ATP-binding cassette domain-containing protein [Thermoanaerobaculia bacterium]
MKARFFVPETIQTSAVDCGPAALKSLLEGFGIAASYGRLREACQTGLDGTSIDTIEVVAREVGLDAQQVMLPADYLALDDTVLPAVVVIRTPTGMAHFIVVWRKAGPFFQIMDPASGRRWVRVRDLLSSVYVHRQTVPAAGWREWASSEDAMRVLRRRIASVAGARFAEEAIARVLRDEAWQPLARLDAATRLTETLVRNGAVRRGGEAERLLDALGAGDIPAPFWPVSAADDANVVLRGAVLIRIGRGTGTVATANEELAAAVREPRVRPLARVLSLLSPTTRRALPMAALGAVVLGVSPVAEGLLFRSMYDLVTDVGLPQERLAILGAFALFAAFLVALDYAVTNRAVKWGHELQARFATSLFGTLSTLRNDYFGSRLISDLAERSHAIAELRSLPLLLSRVLRASGTFAITFAALLFLMPQASGTLVLGGLALLAIALGFQPLFAEIDLRARTHTGGLTRFYLDALAGLGAIHAHCAERAVRREHESLMTDWVRALRRQIAAAVSQTTILAAAGFALAAVLIRRYVTTVEDPGGVLLIAYWALNLPLAAADLAQQLQIWASQRSVVLRLIEPLDAPREETGAARPAPASPGVSIAFHHASFAAAGHAILHDVDLDIPAGLHVGIVGSSGAGKSTLAGALLGFMQPSKGEIRIDGEPLTLARAGALRRETAWVDPAIQLFNAPMEENVRYASNADDVARLPFALSEAGLYEVLQRIPDSQMPLGEGGGMLSGGEGQRVRLARALMQAAPRLVILDEAFRGMDRAMRDELLRRCRRLWSEATFLFVTHDVEETLDCDRVLVMKGGRVAEYDTPAALIARDDSLYNRMRDANREIREELWGSDAWRRLELRDGHLVEEAR